MLKLNTTYFKEKEKNYTLIEDLYQTFVKASHEAIILEASGKILSINQAGLKLFQARSKDEIIGKPLTDFISPLNGSEYHPLELITLTGTRLAIEMKKIKAADSELNISYVKIRRRTIKPLAPLPELPNTRLLLKRGPILFQDILKSLIIINGFLQLLKHNPDEKPVYIEIIVTELNKLEHLIQLIY